MKIFLISFFLASHKEISHGKHLFASVCVVLRGGTTEQSFIRGGSVPRSKPLLFYIPFFTEKVPHSYLPLKNGTPLTYLLNTNKSLKHEVFLSFNFRVTFEV